MRPLPVTTAGQWQVKRYELTVDGGDIAPQVKASADAMLAALLVPDPPTPGTPALAFSVLHRGVDAMWLNAYSWCRQVILRCRLASAPLESPLDFTVLSEPMIGCVWELPALVHERSAWVRHILKPEVPDEAGYLADLLPAGPVGGA